MIGASLAVPLGHVVFSEIGGVRVPERFMSAVLLPYASVCGFVVSRLCCEILRVFMRMGTHVRWIMVGGD